jgi:MFS family permease
MTDDLKAIERRTIRSFYDDGLFEIALGAILLLLGGYFFGELVLPESSPLHAFLSSAFVLVIVFAGLLINKILRFLKARITYPRAGYVSFRKERSPKRRWQSAALGALIGGSFPFLMSLVPSFKDMLPAINGLLFGVVFLLLANKSGVARYYILSLASIAIGIALAAAGIGDTRGISLFYALFGAAMVLSGLAALIVFLRRNKLAPEAVDEP